MPSTLKIYLKGTEALFYLPIVNVEKILNEVLKSYLSNQNWLNSITRNKNDGENENFPYENYIKYILIIPFCP